MQIRKELGHTTAETQPCYIITYPSAALFGERTNVVSPDGIIEREHFYKALNKLADGEKEADLTFNQQYQGRSSHHIFACFRFLFSGDTLMLENSRKGIRHSKPLFGSSPNRIQGAVKEKNKQEEFFQPTREYVGDQDIQGMGFDESKSWVFLFAMLFDYKSWFSLWYECTFRGD